MPQIHCEFSEPIDLGSKQVPDYEFSVLDCTSTDATSTLFLVQNSETGAEFYLDKTINYGEVLVLTFLLLFAIFGIVKLIADFWIPHRVIRKS